MEGIVGEVCVCVSRVTWQNIFNLNFILTQPLHISFGKGVCDKVQVLHFSISAFFWRRLGGAHSVMYSTFY